MYCVKILRASAPTFMLASVQITSNYYSNFLRYLDKRDSANFSFVNAFSGSDSKVGQISVTHKYMIVLAREHLLKGSIIV